MVVTAAGDGSAFIALSAESAGADTIELFEAIGLQDLPSILIAPTLPTGTDFPGVHLVIGPSLSQGLFARSSRRYKQAVMVDLLCTGSSLELGHGIAAAAAALPLDQHSPPRKR